VVIQFVNSPTSEKEGAGRLSARSMRTMESPFAMELIFQTRTTTCTWSFTEVAITATGLANAPNSNVFVRVSRRKSEAPCQHHFVPRQHRKPGRSRRMLRRLTHGHATAMSPP